MARNFNGSTDQLEFSAAGLVGATHGTYAILGRCDDTAAFRTAFCFVTSGNVFKWSPIQVDATDDLTWDGVASDFDMPTGVWALVVVRKPSGSLLARYSVYNYSTDAWTHGTTSANVANGTAVVSSDKIALSTGDGAESWDGDMAVMAAWPNELPWPWDGAASSDTAADARLEQSGLQWDLLALLNTYSVPVVDFVGVGTRGAGTTTTTPTYPTNGNTAGNLTLAFRTIKPSTATATDEAGWTNLLNVTGGTGVQGIDTGPQRLKLDYRTEAGGAASPTFDQASSPNSVTSALLCFKNHGGAWATPVVTNGDDNTHGTGRSATGSAIDMQPGDKIVILAASDADHTTTFTSPTLTASGFTFTTPTTRLAPGGSATGQDVGSWVYEATVLTGSGSQAPTFSVTGGDAAGSCGQVAFVRLRATSGGTVTPPDWLVVLDQQAVSQAVVDITGGGGNQVAITGTTVTDGPPGFGYGADPIVSPGHAVSGDVTVSPATIARSFTVPQAAVSVDAVPATIARAATVPQATVAVEAQPTTLARAFTVPQSAVSVEARPATIAQAFTIPQVTAGEGGTPATVVPDTIARSFTVPQVTVAVDAVPAVLARAFALPQASAGVDVTPATIARAFTVPQVTIAVMATPVAVARAFALPQAAVSVGVVPAAIARLFAIPQVSAVGGAGGDATVVPDTIARVFVIPQPQVSAGASPATIVCVFTMPQVNVTGFLDPILAKPWKFLGGGPPIRGTKYPVRRPGWS